MTSTTLARAVRGALLTVALGLPFSCSSSDDAGAAADGGLRLPDASAPVVFGDGSTGGSCDTLGLSSGCTACIERSCCTEASRCDGESECMQLVTCARDCSGGADGGGCTVACLDDHSTGLGSYNELVLCMGESCIDECPYATP